MDWLDKLMGRERGPVLLDSPLARRVKEEMRDVEAYANSHGGSLKLVSVSDEGEVVIKMVGTCSSCPLSTITLKQGVEKALKSAIPEVTSVRAL